MLNAFLFSSFFTPFFAAIFLSLDGKLRRWCDFRLLTELILSANKTIRSAECFKCWLSIVVLWKLKEKNYFKDIFTSNFRTFLTFSGFQFSWVFSRPPHIAFSNIFSLQNNYTPLPTVWISDLFAHQSAHIQGFSHTQFYVCWMLEKMEREKFWMIRERSYDDSH